MTTLFAPLPAGADLRDRMIGAFGAALGMALTYLVSAALLGPAGLPLLAVPVAASAVLVFVLPASPMARPWSIVGGNTISAFVGVAVAKLVPDVTVAAGLAVGAAIVAMALMRCLHPAGASAALTGVVGGPVVAKAGFLFPLLPVALDSALVVASGWLFHRFTRHSYPHRAAAPVPPPSGLLNREDIDSALAEAGEAFDISRADLDMLLTRAEAHAAARSR